MQSETQTGFELGSLVQIPTAITVMFSAPPLRQIFNNQDSKVFKLGAEFKFLRAS